MFPAKTLQYDLKTASSNKQSMLFMLYNLTDILIGPVRPLCDARPQ